MADASRSIIFTANLDTGQLTKQAAELAGQIGTLKQEQKELATAGKQNTVEFQNNANALRSLQREYKNTTIQIDANVRATNAADKSYEQLLNATKLLEIELKTLPNAFDANNTRAKELQKQIDLNKTALLGFNAQIQDGRLNVGNYGNTIDGLRQKYSVLQDKLKTLDLGSEEFKKTQSEITKTRDQLGLAEGRFDEFGERIKKGNAETLDTFNDVGQGAVAAFALAPLLNENLNAAELQAQALKAIAIAQNTVALAKGVANAKDAAGIIISKASVALTVAQAVALKAAGFAQNIFSKGVLTSSLSLRIFKGALISTGIGAIIVLIGELIANWDEITNAVGRFIGISKQAATLTGEDYERMSEQAKKASENFKKQIDINISLIKDERTRRLEEIKEAARRELQEDNLTADTKRAIQAKLANDLANANAEFDKKEKDRRDKERKEVEDQANKLFEIRRVNLQRQIELEEEGAVKELALFDLETQSLVRAARKRGEDLAILDALRAKQRLELEKKVEDELLVKAPQRRTKALKDQLVLSEELANRGNVLLAKIEEAAKRDEERARKQFELNELRLSSAGELAGGLISILSTTQEAQEKNATLIKTLSLSQAIIQGLLAVQKALASAPPPFNFIAAATVGITSAANVAKIASTPAFATGGLTGKRISSGDGIPIRRSNGDNLLATVRTNEVILNQRQQAALGGARTFRAIGVPGFADGGFVNSQIRQEINNTIDPKAIVTAMKQARFTVGVDEITKKQDRVEVIETSRTL